MLSRSLLLLLLPASSIAVPAVGPTAVGTEIAGQSIEKRDPGLLGDLGNLGQSLTGNVTSLLTKLLPGDGNIRNQSVLKNVLDGVATDLTDATLVLSAYGLLLQNVVPSATPTSIPQVMSIVAGALPTASTAYTNIQAMAQNVGELILNSLSPQDLTQNVIGGYLSDMNSYSNKNPAPSVKADPKTTALDAQYSQSESTLRSAIYIPSSFEYGRNQKQPVILVPGTATFGGVTYASNFAKLLAQEPFADPVWINVPGALLGDAQVNAEFVAYAIQYISSVSQQKNVSVVAWSQGNLDTQWALKYWPSTQKLVSDFIAISPDFHGTVEAFAFCPSFPDIPCDPSVIQQEYTSNFIATLRANGGDSAYVPTTTIYSIYDEVVQPQSNPGASAFINDARNVGVSNNQLQSICPNLPAGSIYTHEGVLYNPVAYALAVDALTHPGPGQISRLDLNKLCNQYAADGLSLSDVIATEGLIPVFFINFFLYTPKLFSEPSLKPYAAS